MDHLLVLVETDGAHILPTTRPMLTFAQEWARGTGGTFDLLALLGDMTSLDGVEEWRQYGVTDIILVQRPEFAHPVCDQSAATVALFAHHTAASALAGPSSTWGCAVLAYTAGLLDWPMVSDVMQVQKSSHGFLCRRPTYAGQAIATWQVPGENVVFSVRGASYGPPQWRETSNAVTTLNPPSLPSGTTWRSQERQVQARPELAQARVVVAGGRPLRDAETFERLLGGLADRLGGAVGASGGAVGAGLAPDELLIGQTGKSVAPELYIAAGISGSDQHVAGIRDSRVIVAINADPHAPIFGDADYGLVADIHQALPELLGKLSPP